ncbi:flagellar export chaperone FlgN [bacterium]|nr:flagellar export chaperone FlgN [bacterium]
MDMQISEKILGQIEVVFNEILSAYTKMADLYEVKKNALIKMDAEILKETDEQILANNDLLIDLNNERLRIIKQMGVEEMTVSEIIEKAEEIQSPLLNYFKEFKVKINEVSKKMTLLEQTNVELIQHGLAMSNTILDIILQACTPQGVGYDCHGKNSQSQSTGVSSICEDA